MVDQEILENNILIAEFMGVFDKIFSTGNIHSWSDPPFYYTTENSKEKVIKNISQYAKYHSSWDWLMPVVEKIENLESGDWYIHIIGGKQYSTTKIEDGNEGSGLFDCMVNVPNCVGFGEDLKLSKIETTYKAIIEFIKWYNEMIDNWICTDPSCNQYRKEIIKDEIYWFKEDRIINPETYETEEYNSEIDLREYTEDEIKDALNTFGYEYIEGSIKDSTGEIWSDAELVAECLFELEN